jgi:ABC-2 type transport system ATP-binding protein
MVQRLGLAQCLLHEPDIYILDEPMSGLDPLGRMLVRDIILDLKKRNKCVFMSTHILNDVETICDRVGIIVKGSLRLVESLQSIAQRGIKGYTISFASASERMIADLTASGDMEQLAGEPPRYFIQAQAFETVIGRLFGDKTTQVQLVEPGRRGLEEVFAGVVHED